MASDCPECFLEEADWRYVETSKTSCLFSFAVIQTLALGDILFPVLVTMSARWCK